MGGVSPALAVHKTPANTLDNNILLGYFVPSTVISKYIKFASNLTYLS